MKHYVFGRTGSNYNCVVVDAPVKTHYSRIEEIAKNENEGFVAYEVVTGTWAKLFKQYDKLHKKCAEQELFTDGEVYETVNGYDVNECHLWKYGYIYCDDVNDIILPIYYLNEVEFYKVVDMLDTLVKSI